jgi:hypothetical protein
MVQNTDQIDQGGWFADDGGRNEFWGGAGDATLGAAHTMINAGALLGPEALPFVMAADKALSIGELGVNGVGAAAGVAGEGVEWLTGSERDWGFDAGDVVGAGEHALYSTAASTYDTLANGDMGTFAGGGAGALLGGGIGTAASLASFGMLAPLVPLLAAGGGALGASLADNGVLGTGQAMMDWF